MITRFFCFPDMLTSFALAQQHGMVATDETGEPMLIRFSHEWAIDVIGEIEGSPGWHINVRTAMDVPSDFIPYEVFPESPIRDFT